MAAAASAAKPAVTPGMIRKGMPAAASVIASSPPRPNTKGSPPLSRNTRSPGARQRDQPLADIGLDRRRLAAALAGKFKPRLRAGQRQDAWIDQRVVHHDVGLRQAGQRIEREQARIARPGAGEPDVARLEDRNAGAPRRQGRPTRVMTPNSIVTPAPGGTKAWREGSIRCPSRSLPCAGAGPPALAPRRRQRRPSRRLSPASFPIRSR